MVTSSSGFMPVELVDVIKSEVCFLAGEQRTRTFSVEWRVERGALIEARVRSRECLRIVDLST